VSDPKGRAVKQEASRRAYVWAVCLSLPALAALAFLGFRAEGRQDPFEQPEQPPAEEQIQASASAEADDTSAPEEQPLPTSVKAGAELFVLAKSHEESRNYVEAEAIYRSAVRKLSGSSEAYEAAVAAAELNRTELHHPARALKLYRQAKGLRPDGWHRERVLIGIGLTAQAIADETEELRAWSELVARFPNSDHAGEAEKRLAVLTARNRAQPELPSAPPASVESEPGSATPPPSDRF
jgi:tetratricopeptide (TPR) repeat protein